MYSDLLNSKLRDIVKMAIREKWSLAKLTAAIREETKFVYRKEAIQDAIVKANVKDFDFLKGHTLNDMEYDKLNKIFSDSYAEFAKQSNKINIRLATIVKAGFAQDLDRDKIIERAEAVFSGQKYNARTVVDTAQGALSQLKNFVDAREAGIEEYRYNGAPPQRAFCRRLYHNTYTITQINALSREQEYDVMLYRGRWNCRHWWEAIV